MSRKSITFACEIQNNKKIRNMKTISLNITSIIIRLRLQQVGGSDKVCV